MAIRKDTTLGDPRDVLANNVYFVIAEEINIGLYFKTATPVNLPPTDQFVHFIANDALFSDSPLVIGAAMDSILNKNLTELKRVPVDCCC